MYIAGRNFYYIIVAIIGKIIVLRICSDLLGSKKCVGLKKYTSATDITLEVGLILNIKHKSYIKYRSKGNSIFGIIWFLWYYKIPLIQFGIILSD